MSLNSALSLAGRSLEVFSSGLQVVGQNIANAATPGYIREEMHLEAADPYRRGALIFGTGVLVGGIRQTLDKFLEVRLHAANSEYNASAARDTIFKQLETQINELGDSDLSTRLNSFLAAINDAATEPESGSLRQLVVQQGELLARDIGAIRGRIDALRSDQTVKVNSLVAEANDLINQIARLNPQISKLEASGLLKSDAGALRTQRYTALNRLSEIIPIKFTEREDGSVDVFSGSNFLILEGHVQQLTTEADVDRGVNIQSVILSETKSPVSTLGGELAGVIEGRDEILGGFVDQLDEFTGALISAFNRIHSSGEGLVGFSSVTGTTQVLETTSALSAAGLAFPPSHGSFALKVTNTQTGSTTTTTVPIDLDGIDPANDTSLTSLRDWINGNVSNVTASITNDGLLQLSGASGYELKFSNDTSGVLGALGINTFFTGTDSNTIGVNDIVASDARYLASGQGAGPADGATILQLAQFVKNPIAGLQGRSLDDFYDAMLTSVAAGSSAESAASTAFASVRDSLTSQRSQTSGVSLDEEAIKALEYQRAFQSAARMISTVDELFDVLLSM